MGSRPLRIGVALLGLLSSPLARAEERPRGLARLEWLRAPGAEGCLAEAEIVEDVERLLKRRVFTDGTPDRVLRAAIAPSPEGWHASIELSTARGVALGARELELDGSDCREASDALVLAISLMADLPELPEERPKPPPPAPAPAPPAVRFRASIAPAVIVDDRPAVHPAADLALEIVPRRFVPVLVDLVFQAQARTTTGNQQYWLFGGTLAIAVCPLHLRASRVGLLGCIGPEATLYAARGRGFSVDETAFSSTVGGLAQARATYAFTERLRGLLFLGGIATPQRVELTVGQTAGGRQVADRTSYVLGAAGLGVTLEL